LQARWLGESSKPSLMVLPESLGPGAADPKPSHLLPDVLYETVLGTQVTAIVSFFIVLLGASLALTTVKGARLKKRLAPHIVTSTDLRKRKQEKERLAAAAGLFRATESAFEQWKLWKRLERLVERSDLPLRTVELFYLMVGCGFLGAFIGSFSGRGTLITLAILGAAAFAPVGF